MAKRGPKKAFKDINWEVFEGLCRIHCTKNEIIGFLKVSASTFQRGIKKQYGKTFEEVYPQYQSVGKVSARRKIWDLAVNKGNVHMLKMIAENHLDMSQKSQVTANVTAPTGQTLNSLLGGDAEKTELVRQLQEKILAEQALDDSVT